MKKAFSIDCSEIYFTKNSYDIETSKLRDIWRCVCKRSVYERALQKRFLHMCNERTRFSVSWKSFFNGVSRQEKDLFHRLYPHYIVYIQFTHTRNFQVDGCRSKENLFGQSALLKNATYIVFPLIIMVQKFQWSNWSNGVELNCSF